MDAEKSEAKVFNKCALPQCKGLRFNLFHKFPRNPERCKVWLEAFDNPTLYATPHLRLVQQSVCSRHFRVSDYVHPESRKLNLVAVPNLNLKTLNELDKCRHGKTNKIEYERERRPLSEYTRDVNTSNVRDSAENELEEWAEVIDNSNDVSVACESLLNDNLVSSSEIVDDTSLGVTCVEDSSGFQLVVNEGFMQIKDSQLETSVKADILWLRYICHCNECFDSKENKSLISFFDFDEDLQPVMATVIEETRRLDIIWSDGHTSTYNLNQLYEKLQHKQLPNKMPNHLLWTFQHTQYRDDLQPINWYDLIQCNKTTTYKALDRLQKSGVLIINQVPKYDTDSLLKKSIITKIFNQSCTNFINEKRKHFTINQNSTPFSNCTFESMDKGLQILTVPYDRQNLKLQLSLVDGFQAIEQLPKATQEFLAQTPVDYSFIDDQGYTHKIQQSVITKMDHMERVWFSPYHLDTIKSSDFRQVSKHFKQLNDVLKMPPHQWPVELNAETIIILDNYRICWCVSDAPKDCELDCMYMERKHYLSSLNKLRNTIEG